MKTNYCGGVVVVAEAAGCTPVICCLNLPCCKVCSKPKTCNNISVAWRQTLTSLLCQGGGRRTADIDLNFRRCNQDPDCVQTKCLSSAQISEITVLRKSNSLPSVFFLWSQFQASSNMIAKICVTSLLPNYSELCVKHLYISVYAFKECMSVQSKSLHYI